MTHFPLAKVVAARHAGGHVVWLRFDDGLEGEVDLSDGLHCEMFEPLRDEARFAEVHVEYGTVTWPNGADWPPESLYERLRASNGLPPRANVDDEDTRATGLSGMPEISRFYGLVIRMLANDDAPPHFHAEYGEYEVTVTIRAGIVSGRMPGRALRIVLEWRDLHQSELLANWERLRAGQPPEPIEPLS